MEMDARVLFWARVERILDMAGWWLLDGMVFLSFYGALERIFWIVF